MENFFNQIFTEIIVGGICTLLGGIFGFTGGYYYHSNKSNSAKINGNNNNIKQDIK